MVNFDNFYRKNNDKHGRFEVKKNMVDLNHFISMSVSIVQKYIPCIFMKYFCKFIMKTDGFNLIFNLERQRERCDNPKNLII